MTLIIGLSLLVTQKSKRARFKKTMGKKMRKMLLLLKHDDTFVSDSYRKKPEITRNWSEVL